jgi:RimJ/RimL family protein N-acetyltransferase
MYYQCEKTESFTYEQKICFQKLLELQGQVARPSLEKLNACPFLCLAYVNELLIGIGAIKKVYTSPFVKAKVPSLKDKYSYEMGYIYVLNEEKYRGKGIGKSICIELLKKVESLNVFATTEENEENRMKQILKNLGFIRVGETYQGENTNKDIGLYLLDRN